MKLGARVLCACAVMGVATWTIAGPIDDARELFNQGDFQAVDKALESELNRPDPSVEALTLSVQAAQRSGRIVTAATRMTALLKTTENKDADLLLQGARIAGMLGDDRTAHNRYLAYVRLNDQKTEDLREAMRFVLNREAYVDVYRRFVEYFGANEESRTLGERALDRLIAVPDPKGALEIAVILQESFPEAQHVARVHRALHSAAESYTFGTEPADRFLPPLRAMMHGYTPSTGWIDALLRGIEKAVPASERLEMFLAYHERFKKPVHSEMLQRFGAIAEVEDESARIAFGRRYLALEPIYANAEDPAVDYDRYLRNIFDRRETFLIEGKPLVSTDMAKGFLENYKRRYDREKWSTPIGYVQWTISDPQAKVAFYREHLVDLSSNQVSELLRLADDENVAAVIQAHNAGKPMSYSVRVRWGNLERFNRGKDKAGLLAAARDGLMITAGSFDPNQIRHHFLNSELLTADEKLALLREIITAVGITPPVKEILDGMAKSKAEPDSWGNLPAFQELMKFAESKPKPTNTAAAALAELIAIKERSNNPDPQVLKTVETFLQSYRGKIPGGEDQVSNMTELLVREIFKRHQSHVRDSRDGIVAWVQLWSPRIPAGDFWRTITGTLAQRRYHADMFDVAKRYVELTRNDGGDPEVWSNLTLSAKDGERAPAPLGEAYSRMGTDLAMKFLFDRRNQFNEESYQTLVDEMAKAVAVDGRMEQLARVDELIGQLSYWSRNNPPEMLPPAALIKALDANYRRLAGDDASLEKLATIHLLYRRGEHHAEAQAKLKSFLDAADRMPALEKANALGIFLQSAGIPTEAEDVREATELKPDMRLHIAVTRYLPALQQVPQVQWPSVTLQTGIFGIMSRILETPDHPLREQALAHNLQGAEMYDGGASLNGAASTFLPALSIIAREKIDQSNWIEFNRYAGLLAEIVGSDNNPEHHYNNYARALVPLLTEQEAAEPLYAMLWQIERRAQGPEAFLRQIQIAKAQAAGGITDLIPVPQNHALYDLYRAANAVALGQEAQAWELVGTPARIKLLNDNWSAFSDQFVVWTIEQLRKQKGDSLQRALEFCFTVLLEESRLDPEAAASILLTRGDIYRDQQNYPAARLEYEGLRNNDRYRTTEAGLRAVNRLVELHVLTRNYAEAEAMLQRMINSDDINTQAEAYYLYARIEFQQQNYDEAADHVRRVKERVAGHVEAALLEGELKPFIRGGMDNPIIEIGLEQLQTTLVPGRPLILKLHDRNLSIARAGAAIPVVVRTSVGGDEEHVRLLPSSSNRNLFQATIPTALGGAEPGNMILDVSGADVVSYAIDEEFQAANNLSYPPKVLEVRSDARLQASSEQILSPAEQEQRELELRLRQQAQQTRGSRQLDISRDGRTVRPGSPIYVQVVDPDRSGSSEPDTVLVDLNTTSGDVIENFELVETGPHTGIFQGAVPTSIPLPRADASDTDPQANPSSVILIDDNQPWVSLADAVSPKWIEVDTMSSSEVASATIELPNPGQVRSATILGMLADHYEELAAFPARPDSVRGGLTLDFVAGNQGHTLDQIQRHLRLAPTTSKWQESTAFDRKSITESNGWYTTRLRGTFYLSEPKALELKFVNDGVSHLFGYALIDGQHVLGGSMGNERDLSRTARVELPAGAHTLELVARHHEASTRIVLGYRTDEGDYAPIPDEWFSVEANPELVEVLKPRGTLEIADGKATLKLETPQRLRRMRLVFNDFDGLSVSAGKFTIIDTDGRQVVPVKEDFTQGLNNRVLEIAPGDEIAIHYTDTKRLWDGEQVLRSRLNSAYHNGRIHLVNEVIETDGENRRRQYLPARRVRAGDQLAVVVTDYDLDTTRERDQVQVRVRSSSGQELVLQALETDMRSDNENHHRHAGEFFAIVRFDTESATDTLKIQPGDRITVSYLDAENTNPGVPVEREFSVAEAGRGSPEILVYRSSITMVQDKSIDAQAILARRGSVSDEEPVKLYRPQPISRHPDYLPPDASAENQPPGIISSVAAPLLWEVTYPKMAMHQGSTLNATLVAESELRAAERDGREPQVVTVPMSLEPLDHLARSKGYPMQVQTHIRRGAAEMLRDGVFAGVARLQIGSPGDPIDDLIIHDDIESAPIVQWGDSESAYRVPTLLVSGSDVIHIRVTDEDRDTVVDTSVQLRSQARLELVDAAYRVQRDTIHLGERFWVRVTDPSRDVTDERDEVQVEVLGSSGDRMTLTLSETLPHSGVFTAGFEPTFIGERVDGKVPAPSTGDDALAVFFGEEVTFTYVDQTPLDSIDPRTITSVGKIHLGSDAELATFTKQFKDPEIAVRTRFLMAEALFEMAKEHRRIGQTDQARDEIARGKQILEEALRDYPDTALAAQGDYLLANLAEELGNFGEAISRYSAVVSAYPDSEYAPLSQYKKALCYERQENFALASEEYVKLTYVYPEHALVADATIRLGNHYYKEEAYQVAGRIFQQFHRKHPTHRLAARALLLAGHCEYRLQEFKNAAPLFNTVVENYTEEIDVRAEAMYWLADSLYQDGSHPRAYQIFKRLTWDYPDNKWAKFARGRLTDEALMRAGENH